MKECGHCHRVLDSTSFYPDRTRRSGLSSWCRECKQKQVTKQPGYEPIRYTDEELSYLPAEQLREALSCRRLGSLLGVNKDTAARMLHDSWELVDTPLEWDDQLVARVRAALRGETFHSGFRVAQKPSVFKGRIHGLDSAGDTWLRPELVEA